MNKKVLSCALVAAMLASSVSALNVSAFDAEKYEAYTAKSTALSSVTDLSEIYIGTYEDAMEEGLDGDLYYLFDYKRTSTESATTYDDVLNALTDAVTAGDTTKGSDDDTYFNEAVKAINQYFTNTDGTAGTFESISGYDTDNGAYTMTDTRKAILDLFDDQKAIADDFDETIYYASELEEFNIWKSSNTGTLTKALQDATRNEKNSELLHLAVNGDYFFNMLGVETSWEERYNDKVEEYTAIPESDYKDAANYRKMERLLEDAEYMIEEGTEAEYKKAYDALVEGYKTIVFATVKYTDLRNALEGLFSDGKIPAYVATQTYDEYSNTNYDKDAYVDADDDAWYAFAGNKASSANSDYVKGAFRSAMEIYDKCKLSTTRKELRQSQVDEALNNLNDSLLGLTAEEGTKNWVIVKLEDALDAANAVIEDDYRTTSSTYKKFLAQKETVEKMLDAQYVETNTASKAADDLVEAIAEIRKSARKPVPAATKNEWTDLKKEGTKLLKDKEGKTATQIANLEKALEANISSTTSLISEYETAIADLNKAIAGYNQAQGWYKDANGVWYYGKEDTVAKGWLNVNGVWYLMDSTTGAMKTGWQQVNGTWYYLQPWGGMATGWLNLNGTYYYLESWGGMATGWKNVNGSWYYLQSSGAMVSNGWYWINGKCYYFRNWGGMAANTTIDGYKVGADGAWVK